MQPTTEQSLLTTIILFLPKVMVAIVVMVIGLVASGLLSRIMRRAMERRKFNREFIQFTCELTKWTMICLTVIIALQQVQFDVTAFLTGLGILGFTVGFALQDVSKNFVAGLLLLLQQPFSIGEFIEVASYSGRVSAISMRATALAMDDGKIVLIPNATVFTSPIVKHSEKMNEKHVELKQEATQ